MRLRLPLHGRSHLPQGSDPMPWTGFIRYDFDNVGDWLFVKATGAFSPDWEDARVQGGSPAMLFKAVSHNAAGDGIVLWSHDDEIARDPVWQLAPSGLYYFLDGQDDTGYTEGGDILRYTSGGNVVFYTFDGETNSGDFVVNTGSTLPDAGSIILNASQGDDSGGIQFYYGTDGTLDIFHNSTLTMQFQADGTIHIQTGATLIADL